MLGRENQPEIQAYLPGECYDVKMGHNFLYPELRTEGNKHLLEKCCESEMREQIHQSNSSFDITTVWHTPFAMPRLKTFLCVRAPLRPLSYSCAPRPAGDGVSPTHAHRAPTNTTVTANATPLYCCVRRAPIGRRSIRFSAHLAHPNVLN